ncbi:toprim domain-containing protein [Methylobacterium ajmalii]|uniref:Toprim domain-containing protein n=1 Tax=Methylobacterium ajmalii TaxID=2738439 RepID=A0ABV0A4C5_9HYPH
MSGLRERARGRWRTILPQFGIDHRHLSGRHGPCPFCGGEDRFRWDNREGDGTYFCSACGPGSGADMVMKHNGWDFATAAREIEKIVGSEPLERVKAKYEAPRRLLNTMWGEARPITDVDAAGRFLARRLGPVRISGNLRYHPNLRYDDDEPTYHPGMLAIVHDPDGQVHTLHRTYLTPDGEKANVKAPRRVMPGSQPKGCAIRLFPHARVMAVAEGIETALAVHLMTGLPVWSLINAGNLAEFTPPDGVEQLMIYGDNDEGFAGQAAAYTLARRMVARRVGARVFLPEAVGDDFNDVWIGERVKALFDQTLA